MKIPVTEMMKSIPALVGIHFDQHAPFEVIENGVVEIRRYAPMTIASFTQTGPHETAINLSFKALVTYLFENNIPMTVPVFQKLESQGVTLSFYLAGHRKFPEPDDKRIVIRKLPERIVAAYSYSGINTPKKMLEGKARLFDHLRTIQDYTTTGGAFWAQYDSPMTIPFLRKNEAMIELKLLS